MVEITKAVIFCSDPDPEANLWKRIKAEIIPPNERWLSIPLLGGAISLARPADLPLEFAFLMWQIERFALNKFHPKGFVVVGHDCGYYKEMLTHLRAGLNMKMVDASVAAKFLRHRFNMPSEAYFKAPEIANLEKLS